MTYSITQRLSTIHQRIADAVSKQPSPTTVQLLAVSKKQPAAAIKAVYAEGQRAFGENYVQEALKKQQELADLSLEWHFIGPIQSNKTRLIAENFDWVHSIDRVKIIERLNAQRPNTAPPLNVCLQLNLDDENNKSGINEPQVMPMANSIQQCSRLRLRGLMAIPAPRMNYEAQYTIFKQIATLYSQLKTQYPDVDTLSMGMSGDMEAAIAAGSTMIRIGTGIFGPRHVE